MQSLYYLSGSLLSGSNLYLIPNYNNYNEYYEYSITDLIVCSSLYEILAFSGSNLLVSFPIENTNLYYIPVSESYFFIPPLPSSNQSEESIRQSNIIISSSISPPIIIPSSSFNWNFTPSTDIISSNNKLIITGSNINILQSQSLSYGFFQRESGSSMDIIVSGSGEFYSSSILVYNNTLLITASYTSSTNTPLLTTFTTSFEGFNYNIFTEVKTFPYIELTYDNVSNIPVSPTNSLDNWNSYLNISASSIINTGSSVYLLNGNIKDISSLIITSSNSLTNVSVIGANNLFLFGITTGSLSSFPIFQETPNLQFIIINSASLTDSSIPTGLVYFSNLNLSNNQISGSILDLISTVSQSIQVLDCSYNNLTGSIPSLLSFPFLQYINCSNNQLSESIINLNPNLYYFDCSNNALTSSIPELSGSLLLQHFNVSNNQLSGNIPDLSDNTFLPYFNASNNQLSDYSSGSIPNFLTYINAENNILSQSAIEGLVRDVYNAGSTNGYLNLSGSGNSTASIDTLYTASVLEIDRNWQIHLNGASTIFSASFSDNLFGIPVVPGVTDGLSSSYYSIVDTTLPLTYIYLTGSVGSSYKANFAVSDNNVYEVGLGGWTFVSGSSNLYYSCSLSIVEISESVPGTLISFSSNNIPISWSFTGSALCTYLITGSITYSGSYYTDFLLKYAEAIGYGGGGEIP